jgi:predicted transposase YbfD/YdcC
MLLLEQLKQIQDHRGAKGRRYPLWLLMILILIAKLCGYDGYRDIADFCQRYREKLWIWLEVEKSINHPSYSTFRRTMIEVEPQHWEKVFNTWALATLPENIGRCSSIDGKSIKCTSRGGQSAEQDFVSIVSVYNHENGGVLQLKVMNNKKRSEIEVAKELLDNVKDIDSPQCFTFDALHTQTKTVEKIIDNKQNYLIAVKENQPNLYKEIEKVAQNNHQLSIASKEDNSRGRQVKREVRVYEASEQLKEKWKGLKTFAKVERQGRREGKQFKDIAYYMSNEQLSAEMLIKDIQGHWSIENQLHWVKDVTFQEDAPPRRGGYAPVNWAILFSWLITLVRRARFRTIPQARRLWANQVDEIFAFLS